VVVVVVDDNHAAASAVRVGDDESNRKSLFKQPVS